MKRLLLSFLTLLCFTGMAWAAPEAAYLLDIVHGAPAEQTDAMMKSRGFTELRKKTLPNPAVTSTVYGGTFYGAEGETEVVFLEGITSMVAVTFSSGTAKQKKAAEGAIRKMRETWTKAHGKPFKPVSGVDAWKVNPPVNLPESLGGGPGEIILSTITPTKEVPLFALMARWGQPGE